MISLLFFQENKLRNIVMKESRKTWAQQEDQAIKSFVRKYGHKKWTVISQKMTEKFPNQGRTGKQCRERWFNHLSPQINKNPWAQEELKILFDAHKMYGNKWTEISSRLPGRTDNSIKNQFYSTLRKALRRIYRFLGTNNSTLKIKKIRPTILSLMISHYHSHQNQQGMQNIDIYDVFSEFADDQKYERIKQQEVSSDYKSRLDRILNILIDSKQLRMNFRDFNSRKGSKAMKLKHQIKQNHESYNQIQQLQVGQLRKDVNQQSFDIGLKKFSFDNKDFSDSNFDIQKEIQMKINKGISRKKSIEEYRMVLDQEEQMQEQKPLSIRKQNSHIEPPRIKNKESSLSSQRNISMIYKQDQQENLPVFGFPFQQPLGSLPAFVIKQSHQDSNNRFIDNNDNRSGSYIQRNLGYQKRKKNRREVLEKEKACPKKDRKAEDQKIMDIFQGFL